MKIFLGIPQKFSNAKGIWHQIKLEDASLEGYEIGWRIDNPTSEDTVIKKIKVNCVLFEKGSDSLIHLTTQEIRGMGWCSWLRHCTTGRKIVGSIPDVVVFIDIILPAALWLWRDSVSNRNDYLEYSFRVKAAGA